MSTNNSKPIYNSTHWALSFDIIHALLIGTNHLVLALCFRLGSVQIKTKVVQSRSSDHQILKLLFGRFAVLVFFGQTTCWKIGSSLFYLCNLTVFAILKKI